MLSTQNACSKKYHLIPEVISRLETENSTTLKLYVSPELDWFNGHYRDFFILPGVAQIDWVMHFASQILPAKKFRGIDRLKFSRAIFPKSYITLSLIVNHHPSHVLFDFKCESKMCSSGRVKFTDA